MVGSALLGIFLFPLIFVAILVFVVNGFRNDTDQNGNRAFAVFLATASYVALIALLIGLYGTVNGVAHLARAHNNVVSSIGTGGGGLSPLSRLGSTFTAPQQNVTSSGTHITKNPATDSAWRMIVDGLIVTGIAGYVYWWHRKKIVSLRGAEGFANSAAERALAAQAYLVCFTSVILFIVGAIAACHSLFQLFSPIVFGAPDRGAAFANFARNVFIVLEATAVFLMYRAFTKLFAPKPAVTT